MPTNLTILINCDFFYSMNDRLSLITQTYANAKEQKYNVFFSMSNTKSMDV